jgi:type IV secretory pathway component VirB8
MPHMESEYEVPSPHEHEIDVVVEKEGTGLNQKIALMTAVLATVGALVSYQSGAAQNEALFLKNQSILKQAEASDQWAFYQAKGVKSHLDETTAVLSSDPAVKAHFLAEKAKEDAGKAEIQIEAQKLQDESRKLGEASEAKLRPHERLALALTFIQIAIALAAITVLTRRKWLLWGSIASATGGLGIAIFALALH